jgi:hypothetical protein
MFTFLSAFLLLGVGYIFFPDETAQQQPFPLPATKPEPLIDQILWAAQWILLAAFIAIATVGAVLLINRTRNRKAGPLLN